MKDVIYWLHESWLAVGETCLQRSWKEIGVILDDRFLHEDEIPLARLFGISDDDYVDTTEEFDEERLCHKTLSDTDIVRIVLGDEDTENDETEDDDIENTIDESVLISPSTNTQTIDFIYENRMQITHNTAIDSLSYALQWAEMNHVDLAYILAIRKVREIAMEKSILDK